MTTIQWQQIILTAGGIGYTLFPLGYWFFAEPWWKTAFGRALMTVCVSFAVLIDMSLIAYWFGFTVPDPVATSIYTLIAVGPWLLIAALIHAQWVKRH